MPKLITLEEKRTIELAIHQAEQLTSAEIRVHLDSHCKIEPLDRAVEIFKTLKMDKTVQRNGILIYIAISDKKMAIIGDKGIDQHVTPTFWDTTKNTMITYFVEGKLVEGIIAGIQEVVKVVEPFYKPAPTYINELSNEVTEGN